MTNLSTLKNTSRPYKRTRLLGRGPGSGSGKTCGRGHKGAGSRAGYKRRWGYEGGQMRLHMKLPTKGFSNARFRRAFETVNLSQIEFFFVDGETVNMASLQDCGLISRRAPGVKILGEGAITKKVKIEVHALTSGAREKLQQANIPFTLAG